ncbi:MAG: hypothetical protein GEU99_03165 [Luteitalea sp.]|nr:hypothetical protein [Luteitalea sp.]
MQRWSAIILTVVGVPALLASSSEARLGQPSSTSQMVDIQRLGPQVGERVPDFNLVDQTGNRLTLKSVLGPKGALLVFVRSADW